jgi:hypothetical protein
MAISRPPPQRGHLKLSQFCSLQQADECQQSYYPREHKVAIGGGQWTEQKVSGKQSRTSANATISTKTAITALRRERTAMPVAQ